MGEFLRKKFDLATIDIREEKSKYDYQELEVGEGFLVRKPTGSISGRTSAENKKGDKMFINRMTTNPEDGESAPGARDGASKEHPFTWVIRVK